MQAHDKPWLARRDWVSRRLVTETGALGTIVVSAAVLSLFALVSLVLIAVLGWFGALLGAFVMLAGLVLMVRRARQAATVFNPAQFVCHLHTLPGLVGGWFKADIEAALPVPAESATIELTCMSSPGKRARRVWLASYRLGRAGLTQRPGRCRIPVRFRIPLRLADFDPTRWILVASVTLTGGQRHSRAYVVPIYRTDAAPAEEQRDEAPFDVTETHGDQVGRLGNSR